MFFRFNIFFLAVFFALNLWASISYGQYASWTGIIFSLALVIAARTIAGRWKFTILPLVLVPGSVFLLSLIDSETQMAIFILFSSIIFYISVLAGWRLKQYERDETAKAMYNVATIAVLFFWYAASYGWYLNIMAPLWGLMIVFFAVTFFVSLVSLAINQVDRPKRLIYAVLLALITVQSIWIQNFWPFGYLTTSVITLIIYYVNWSIISNYFLKKTTFRTVMFDVAFLFGATALILLSARWYPVV